MRKFFRSAAGAPPSAKTPQRLLRQALLFGAGLLLLWLAVGLVPTRPAADAPPLYSDASGTVARKPPAASPRKDPPALLTPGYAAALLLLIGGAIFALYLRRRRGPSGGPSAGPIAPLARYPVAPNQQLLLVACGEEVLLLGVTGTQIDLLRHYPRSTFPGAEETGGATPQPTPTALPDLSFAALLQNYAGRKEVPC